MTSTVKRGYIEFPANWTHIESLGSGSFITRIVHKLEDGSTRIWSSRRHRKGFGPEVLPPLEQPPARKRPSLFLWAPDKLNWWIAVLFMIGSFHFIVGSVMVLAGSTYAYGIDLIYFVGSLFFTVAGYSSYSQAINAPDHVDNAGNPLPSHKRSFVAWQPKRLDFWVTFLLFLGTLAFNASTFAAFFNVHWLGYDILVWVPDYVGCILFLVSGTVAVFELCHRFWCWNSHSLTWWIVSINFVGCVAFMISAFAAFVRPDPIFENLATVATITTLFGAFCFFVSAYMTWPEMAVEESAG
jgi:hypothetical protein